MKRITGFTLVELIMVMIIIAAIAYGTVAFIAKPLLGYSASANRAALAYQAEMALVRMGRDVQRAVPNSVRVSGGTSLEYMDTVEAIRYRAFGGTNPLNFFAANTTYGVIGNFAIAQNSTSYYTIIFNTGALTGVNPSPGLNVYANAVAPGPFPIAGTNVINANASGQISPVANITRNTAPTFSTVSFLAGGSMQYALPSPEQRLYISDGPVSYICSGGNIIRYSGYNIVSTQPTSVPTGSSAATLVNNVSACTFTYTSNATQNNGVVSMQITLTQSGESVTLMRQVAVNNAP